MITSKTPKEIKSIAYPKPLVVLSALSHEQTFIILHGRGSNAQAFGPVLLSTRLPDGRTFQTAFPHARFIFPTASKRRAQIYNRCTIHQWADNVSLSSPTERDEVLIDGLRETSRYIHNLTTEAVKEVGAKNVVLEGLSQGSAATLISLLLWKGEPLAASFKICGWLHLRQHMADITNPRTRSDDGNDPFAREEDIGPVLILPTQVIAWLREELEPPFVIQLVGVRASFCFVSRSFLVTRDVPTFPTYTSLPGSRHGR